MATAKLRALLLEQGFSVEDIHTNNGWGFGGWIGKRYTRGEQAVEIGKDCYRHAKPSNRLVYYNRATNEIRWDITTDIIINKILENENTTD